jgi:hypothetical protein
MGDLDPATADVEITRDLLRREMAGDRLVVELGPFSAYILVVAAQELARRPGPQAQAEVCRGATSALERALAGTAAGDLLASGWRALGMGDAPG